MNKHFKSLLILFSLLKAPSLLSAQELSLQQAIQNASKGNRELQIRILESEKAAAAVKEAKSYRLPSVSAGSSYTVFTERPVIYLRNESSTPKVNDVKYGGTLAFDAYIQAGYSILNPVNKSNIKIAGIQQEISKEEIKYAEEELAFSVSRLYLEILLNKEQMQLLEQSHQRNQKALNDSRSLFLQGKGLKTDTLSNYIAVQNLRASIAVLKNNIHVLSVKLNQLMGTATAGSYIFTDSLDNIPAENGMPVSSAGLSIALDNRKDLKIQSLYLNNQKETLEKVKADYKLRLSAFAGYQVQSQADNYKFSEYRLPRTSFAGVKLSIPVYSGNSLKYKTTQSKLSIRQQELGIEELKASINTELITLQSSLQDAVNQKNVQEKNVEAAEVSYRMMNERYYHGLSTRLELADAELAFTKAKLDRLQAVFNIRLVDLQIKKAMGLLELK